MKQFHLAVFAATFAFAISAAFAATSQSFAPIVDAQSGILIGGSKNGKCVEAKATARQLKGGEEYSVYAGSTRSGKTTGSKTRTNEAPCDETHWLTLKKNFNGIIAVGARWNLVPRKVRVQNVNQKIYRDEVAKILKANKIKNPKVVITQLWRVDLDGDKIEEVLISATRYANPRNEKPMPNYISSMANAGDYSMVILRKVVKGKVVTIPLEMEIYSQKKEFSAPAQHRIDGVYDLNGDGKMEVLLDSRYYEGGWKTVIEVQGASAKEVLSAGCGA